MINVAHGPALVRAEIRSLRTGGQDSGKLQAVYHVGRVAEARAFGCLTPRVAKSIGSNSWQPSASPLIRRPFSQRADRLRRSVPDILLAGAKLGQECAKDCGIDWLVLMRRCGCAIVFRSRP